jgi:hypothetical protein
MVVGLNAEPLYEGETDRIPRRRRARGPHASPGQHAIPTLPIQVLFYFIKKKKKKKNGLILIGVVNIIW